MKKIFGSFVLLMMVVLLAVQSTTVYAAHPCPGCGNIIDTDAYCQECYECVECVQLCAVCVKICSGCGDFYDTPEGEVCEDCYEEMLSNTGIGSVDDLIVGDCENCGYQMIDADSDVDAEELASLTGEAFYVKQSKECDNHCKECYEQNKCASCDNCGFCYDKCEVCDNCEACWFHCNDCGTCLESLNDGEYNEDMGLCMDCLMSGDYICPECGELYGDSEKCDNCYMCEDCALEKGLHCTECGECFENVEHCDNGHDPMCIDCAIEAEEHCFVCGECFAVAQVSGCDSDAWIHCEDCCELCKECGKCFLANLEDLCDYCGMCKECESENAICLYCERCLYKVGECETHSEPCCTSCCAEISLKNFGCSHGVCYDSEELWTAHTNKVHLGYTVNGKVLEINFCDISALDGKPWDDFLDQIEEIRITDGVKIIADDAFYSWKNSKANTSVKKVTVSGKATVIGTDAFRKFSGLEELIIGEGVVEIKDYAFYDCVKLAKVTLPKSITKIGSRAFAFTSGNGIPREIIFTGDAPALSTGAFSYSGPVICRYPQGNSTYQALVDSKYNYANVTWRTYTSEEIHIHDFTPSTDNPVTYTWTADGKSCTAVLTCYGCDEKLENECTITSEAKVAPTYTANGKTRYTARFTYNGQNYKTTKDIADIEKLSLGKVTGLAVAAQAATEVTLKWNRLEGATGYILETKNGTTWTRVAKISGGDVVSYKVTDLVAGNTYAFRVRGYAYANGVTANGTNSSILTVATKLSSITGLKVAGSSTNAIRLSWKKTNDAEGYQIEQLMEDGSWKMIKKLVGADTTEYRIANLTAGTGYKFRVRSYKVTPSKMYSDYTNIVTCTKLPAMQNVKVAGRSTNAIRLSWDKNELAEGYQIERMVDGQWKLYKKITSVDTLEYRITGLTAATEYEFRVRAYKVLDGCVSYSEYVTMKTSTK